MSPNWASGPQNQPSANVAVSVLAVAAASIGGTAAGIEPFVRISVEDMFMILLSLAEARKNARAKSPKRQMADTLLLINDGTALGCPVIFRFSSSRNYDTVEV
jgi:hypothetical protein